jgi:hypothetical protein
VRRQAFSSKIDWDPVEFNRALGSVLLIFDSLPVSIPAKTNTKLKTIALSLQGSTPGNPKVEAATDLRSLLLVRHDMCTEASRRECVGCKIDGRVTRGCAGRQFGVDLTNVGTPEQ